MKTGNKNSHHLAVVQQVTNNATSWIGHRRDNEDVISGQTFVAPKEGELAAIEVFSAIVTKPGKIIMTLHNFDTEQKSWGPALGSCSVDILNTEAGKWLAFDMPGLHLDKGKSMRRIRSMTSSSVSSWPMSSRTYSVPPSMR